MKYGISLFTLGKSVGTTCLLLALAIPSTGHAVTLAGVNMPDQVAVSGKTLTLNGLGLRTATFLKVKVYVIGLYLESKASDPEAIIRSNQVKRVAMRFTHDVTAKDLRDAWSEAFEDNYPGAASIKGEISRFNDSMRDVKSGDSLVLDFVGSAVEVLINGDSTATVEGEAFQQAALSIWLGPKPPSDELKAGILGK